MDIFPLEVGTAAKGSVERKFAVSCLLGDCHVHSVISIGRALRDTTTFSWYDLLRWPLRRVRHPTRDIGPPFQPADCCLDFFPAGADQPCYGMFPLPQGGRGLSGVATQTMPSLPTTL